MYYYVNGTVAEIGPNLVVIDCGGVGYACATTNYTLAQLKKGEKAKLYTYLHVREEIFDLYGFASQAELSSFKMLISVSGVGPKAALAILSSGTPDQLALSIVTGDEKALTGVPGIGKKIAQQRNHVKEMCAFYRVDEQHGDALFLLVRSEIRRQAAKSTQCKVRCPICAAIGAVIAGGPQKQPPK